MKKLFILIIALLISSITLISSVKLTAATRSSSKNTRKIITKTTYPNPTEVECAENIDYCFNYYCFNKKTLTNGVYSRCGTESASNIVINVNDCLETRSVIKNLNLKDGCKNYTYTSVVALLSTKDKKENAIKKATKECKEATVVLDAAKSCWAKMISHDGSDDPTLRTKLVALCGYAISKDTDMVDRFYNAGNYGDSNIAAQMDMELTGQNTKKRENWRQVVDGVLAGYIEMAEIVCGEEDYDITKVNDYLPDSRENLAMVRAKAQADEIGRATANRIVNSWFRKTDCLNSPLPKGGLKWEYIEDGAPDCRIVCLDGYEEGATSSECVEKKNLTIAFGGFVTSEKAYVGEPPKAELTPMPIQMGAMAGNPFTDVFKDTDTAITSSKNCDKSVLEQRSYTPTQEGICKLFFPTCPNYNEDNTRVYDRNTNNPQDEYFCFSVKRETDKNLQTYNFWVNITNKEINNMFFGTTKYNQFGDDYASNTGEYLYNNCKNICTAQQSTNNNTVQQSNSCSRLPTDMTENAKGAWRQFITTEATPNPQCGPYFKQLALDLSNATTTPYEPQAHMQQLKECLCNGIALRSYDPYTNEEIGCILRQGKSELCRNQTQQRPTRPSNSSASPTYTDTYPPANNTQDICTLMANRLTWADRYRWQNIINQYQGQYPQCQNEFYHILTMINNQQNPNRTPVLQMQYAYSCMCPDKPIHLPNTGTMTLNDYINSIPAQTMQYSTQWMEFINRYESQYPNCSADFQNVKNEIRYNLQLDVGTLDSDRIETLPYLLRCIFVQQARMNENK